MSACAQPSRRPAAISTTSRRRPMASTRSRTRASSSCSVSILRRRHALPRTRMTAARSSKSPLRSSSARCNDERSESSVRRKRASLSHTIIAEQKTIPCSMKSKTHLFVMFKELQIEISQSYLLPIHNSFNHLN